MLQRRRVFTSVLFAALGTLGAPNARAHIDLLEPEARAHGTAARDDADIDDNSNLKQGPCGQVTTGRTERVATYAPGETLTVRVREENAHISYIRVSLNLDGEDFPLRQPAARDPETQEVAAAAEAALDNDGLLRVYREENDTAGFVHAIEVTLPDATCTNCTLQVLQYMYDDPAAPYYFQCADLVIANANAAEDAGSADGDDNPTATNGGSGGGSSVGAGSSGTGPTAGPAGSSEAPVRGDEANDSSSAPGDAYSSPSSAKASNGNDGCHVSQGARGSRDTGWALLALAVALGRRRARK